MATPRTSLLGSIFNHVALPPKLPGRQEGDLTTIHGELIQRLTDASVVLRNSTHERFKSEWDCVRRALSVSKVVNAGGLLDQSTLVTAFRGLQENDFLILHVAEQNAAVLVRRDQSASNSNVIFETFETSALSAAVLASNGFLEWDFPGASVSLPFSVFDDSAFQSQLADYLSRASTERIERFAAQTSKAGCSTIENRDTTDPGLITTLLTTILEANGAQHFPGILRKHVRDDVCWRNAERPWRRSPFWLVLRVAAQRHLCTVFGVEAGRAHYKFLICQLINNLLEDSLQVLDLESLSFLKTKLCKRLDKLVTKKQEANVQLQETYNYLFDKLDLNCMRVARKVSEQIERQWAEFKVSNKRPIFELPYRADLRNQVLNLPNSSQHIQQVLIEASKTRNGVHRKNLLHTTSTFDFSTGPTRLSRSFIHRYFKLSEVESDNKSFSHIASHNHQEQVIQSASLIESYINLVSDSYDSNPEQKSTILLSIMELWVHMDKHCTRYISLLKEFSPIFPSQILDVLQLATSEDMKRANSIRSYIQLRHKENSSDMTIFTDPVEGCFAERYFDLDLGLQTLHESILAKAETKRERKETEWNGKSEDFRELMEEWNAGTCEEFDVEDSIVPEHVSKWCNRCFTLREAKRIKILVHEHPLSANLTRAKATVFELVCPKAFISYRKITWKIISTFAIPDTSYLCEEKPKQLISDYSELKSFRGDREDDDWNFSLASSTKSWLITHYGPQSFPVRLEKVNGENALNLRYHDVNTPNIWPGNVVTGKLTFAHHCKLIMSPKSPFAKLISDAAFMADAIGPSSYSAIASQTRCPLGLNVHEFLAFQNLYSQDYRRWPQLLLELGSSNLNFSTDSTTLIISHLALKLGRGHPGSSDHLGAVHMIFREEVFCRRLLDQLNERLGSISSNCREVLCMETVITLILRLASLGLAVSREALQLLRKARVITLEWMVSLRTEIQTTTDATISQNLSKYALWASLLCRRTLAIYDDRALNLSSVSLDAEALFCYVISSINLQDNLVLDPTKLPRMLKNALVRDLKLVHCIKYRLRQFLEKFPKKFAAAITTVIPSFGTGPDITLSDSKQQPASESDICTSIPNQVKFANLHGDPWWVEVKISATEVSHEQIIHFHFLEGIVLIDGRPIGKLPDEYLSHKNGILHQLFGNESLLSFPSNLEGMAHQLAICPRGHKIHLGFRQNYRGEREMVVKALTCNAVFELIPSDKFHSEKTFDLPKSLISGCVHFLDTNTGLIEIRSESNIWKTKSTNWIIDFQKREAYRRNRKAHLIDVHSPLFHKITRVFEYFEYPRDITVYQPERGCLAVELRRLDLTFTVNKRHLLECQQLRSEIDPNQDAGTWYGVFSKIVMREISAGWDSEILPTRSIIVPIPKLSTSVRYKRHGIHVMVVTENNGHYGKYAINSLLGRLECPADPRLLYTKALYHALSSFILPDSLTRRTGTKECLEMLNSGYCQPFNPISSGPAQSLLCIANLTPKRVYYPSSMKVMQKVSWKANLTTTIQNDSFREIVRDIFAKSEQLSIFAAEKTDLPAFEDLDSDSHLISRSHFRRQAYQRPDASANLQSPSAMRYNSRDQLRSTISRSNAFECVAIFRKWPTRMITHNIGQILQAWPNIAGCTKTFDKILLSDLLNVQSSAEWFSLVTHCRNASKEDSYQLMFLFASMAFRHDADMDVLRSLAAFAILEELKTLVPPEWPSYSHFRAGHTLSKDTLASFLEFSSTPIEALGRTKQQKLQEQQSAILTDFLYQQWPCSEPSLEGFSPPDSFCIDLEMAMQIIRPEWLRLFQNRELGNYIAEVQSVLKTHHSDDESELPKYEFQEQLVFPEGSYGKNIPTLAYLLRTKSVSTPFHPITTIKKAKGIAPPYKKSRAEPDKFLLARERQELRTIVEQFISSKSAIRRAYGRDLAKSLAALTTNIKASEEKEKMHHAVLARDLKTAQNSFSSTSKDICTALEANEPRFRWLKEGGLWPNITPVTLLESLRSSVPISAFGAGMRASLVNFALSITQLQRLRRIEEATMKETHSKVLEEQRNIGHENWNPSERSDWLLLEIDANILIRPGQVEVALATIAPGSGANSVLQMNCGQGKTSTIIPMAAVSLSDGNSLLRIVVPKSLLLSTLQLLSLKLGGLIGRRVANVPFTRQSPSHSVALETYHDIHREIKRDCGVMVTLAENIMSFKLSGLQKLSDSEVNKASTMIKIQNWLNANSREIIDEVDYVLAIKTQLIYPSGILRRVDGHPFRWEVIETLLKQVSTNLLQLEANFPCSINVIPRERGGFPIIHFLRIDAENELITKLVDYVYRAKGSILPDECTKSDRLAIKKFISEPKPSEEIAEYIQQMFPSKPAIKQRVYLLRGLFVNRILLMTLKKRWNVQYGLHSSRDPIAVPFHAKGTPSDQAEWGHPDVSILFTCLSFYYDGLNPAQLRQSLEHVLKSDDPPQLYDRLCQDSNLPDYLRDFRCINIADAGQLQDILSRVRFHVAFIDYFLNNFVFPRHAKQFQLKLQASGWDIPLTSTISSIGVGTKHISTVTKTPLTTGFSGTNDSKNLLPMTIEQNDLPELLHTNAEVLTYLLQYRNRRYEIAADNKGQRLSELKLLDRLKDRKIRILIDAGAQILEMNNSTLAKSWLEMWEPSEVPAVVYFEENESTVLYRQGHKVPLLASPYADDLGDCLVYLDEAHTRGTDLKMPSHAVGGLTLGVNQTKDSIIQAAMRLRQLGTTQSIVTFAPPEVHQSILDLRQKKPGESIDSYDVICWLLEQTCCGIEQMQPLYFAQGIDYCRRATTALENPDFLMDDYQRDAFLKDILQVEQRTLKQLYSPHYTAKLSTKSESFSPDFMVFVRELNKLKKAFQDSGSAVHGSALQEVEQEREVAIEVQVENVREPQKTHYGASIFPGLHRDITNFTKTGRLVADSSGYYLAFHALGKTTLGRKHVITSDGTSCRLFVSAEFARTVNSPTARALDQFQRNVNWILWSTLSEVAMIIIAEEAELLLPALRNSQSHIHLLTYAAPVTRRMLAFNDMNYYSVPRLPEEWKAPTWLKIELGIFSGRLYFQFSDYEELCKYVGVRKNLPVVEEDEDELPVKPGSTHMDSIDVLAKPTVPHQSNIEVLPKTFTKKPLVFLQEWLAIRRKGQDFTHTPMGYLCQNKMLNADHPYFSIPQAPKRDELPIRSRSFAEVVEDDEEEDEEEEYYDANVYDPVLGEDEKDDFDEEFSQDGESTDTEDS